MPTKKPAKTTTLESTVKAYEVTKLAPIAEDPVFDDGLRALAVACNGCVYQGDAIEAQIRAIRFLRTRPDIAAALGLGQA